MRKDISPKKTDIRVASIIKEKPLWYDQYQKEIEDFINYIYDNNLIKPTTSLDYSYDDLREEMSHELDFYFDKTVKEYDHVIGDVWIIVSVSHRGEWQWGGRVIDVSLDPQKGNKLSYWVLEVLKE